MADSAGAMRVANIFVSFTSSDRQWAFWIAQELAKLGHVPLVHEWEISAGGDIPKWMEENLEKAEHCLLIASKTYLTKPYSSWERRAAQWAAASERRPNFALPVLIEACDMPVSLAHLKRCELHGLREAEARTELTKFFEPARRPAKPQSFPAGTPTPTAFPGNADSKSNAPGGVLSNVSIGGEAIRGKPLGAEHRDTDVSLNKRKMIRELGQMTLEDFVARLDLDGVQVIRIIATTGRVTVVHLLQSLQEAARRGHSGTVHIQILLNVAYMSDAGRPASLTQTRKLIREFPVKNRGFTVDVRSYAAPAMFRGAIVEHTDGKFSGHLGYYFWDLGQELERQSRWNRLGLGVLPSADPALETCLSWFRHYWGTSIINTIIFDFDDTIFATTDAQVEGWVGAIQRAVAERIMDAQLLRPAYAHVADGGSRAAAAVKEIFLKEQNETRIMSGLFANDPDMKVKQFLRNARLEIREERTENSSVPMQVVLGDIAKLRGSYRLVIVSAASEEMVNRVLLKHDIGYFSYVYGRNPHRTNQEWREVETKSQLFIRLSSMLGVPLERMIFVGDSNSDYRAATQLGIPFIENAFNARAYGLTSLIAHGPREIISGTVPGELIEKIRKIEAQILDRWKKI
jgi:phosphoglycolate phosphatase-like HAD superfamily hydrolase